MVVSVDVRTAGKKDFLIKCIHVHVNVDTENYTMGIKQARLIVNAHKYN